MFSSYLTTESDLKEFLQEVSIMDATFRKLISKDGKTFRTSAFRISCSKPNKDLFYNMDNWPDGAKLRVWIFYKTKDPNLPKVDSN